MSLLWLAAVQGDLLPAQGLPGPVETTVLPISCLRKQIMSLDYLTGAKPLIGNKELVAYLPRLACVASSPSIGYHSKCLASVGMHFF